MGIPIPTRLLMGSWRLMLHLIILQRSNVTADGQTQPRLTFLQMTYIDQLSSAWLAQQQPAAEESFYNTESGHTGTATSSSTAVLMLARTANGKLMRQTQGS